MNLRLSSLSLAAATTLLSLTSFLALVPNPLGISGALAQTSIPQDRKAEAIKLNEQGLQLKNRGQFREALEKLQQALVISKELGNRTGARAAIASLWQVDDGGTQALMNAFYEVLKPGKLTKAEALRQAQMVLIRSNGKATQQRGNLLLKGIGNQLPPGMANRLSHPYYWAPFILIGNGL